MTRIIKTKAPVFGYRVQFRLQGTWFTSRSVETELEAISLYHTLACELDPYKISIQGKFHDGVGGEMWIDMELTDVPSKADNMFCWHRWKKRSYLKISSHRSCKSEGEDGRQQDPKNYSGIDRKKDPPS